MMFDHMADFLSMQSHAIRKNDDSDASLKIKMLVRVKGLREAVGHPHYWIYIFVMLLVRTMVG